MRTHDLPVRARKLLIVFASLLPAHPAAGAETDPPPGPRPVTVELGFFLLDFARINPREESFDLHGYLLMRWRDPRLAWTAGDSPRQTRQLQPETVWVPEFAFPNALERVTLLRESDLTVQPDGTVARWIHLGGRFSTPLDLRRFPFDRQRLSFLVEPAEPNKIELRFIAVPEYVRLHPDAFLTDWSIRSLTARVEEHLYEYLGLRVPRFRLEVTIARRATFYVWRVFLPMTLIVAVSWVVFWFDPSGLQPQISTTLSILLSIVLFNFSSDFAQPKVDYLTRLDRHAITSYVFVVAAILTIAAIHVVFNRWGMERAVRWQRAARWIFPTAYLVITLVNAFVP
jgi:hypothetical protein